MVGGSASPILYSAFALDQYFGSTEMINPRPHDALAPQTLRPFRRRVGLWIHSPFNRPEARLEFTLRRIFDWKLLALEERGDADIFPKVTGRAEKTL